MLRKDQWPYRPERLSEIIDPETLAVIQAGCSVRINTALTVLDAGPQVVEQERIDQMHVRDKLAPFCSLLRNERYVQGGNEACEQCDAAVARAVIQNAPSEPYKPYACHMGVQDTRYIVTVHGYPVAVLFAGQHRPEKGVTQICQNVRQLGQGRFSHIIPLYDDVPGRLEAAAEQLTPPPANFQAMLQREAEHIQRIAEAEYERQKRQWEQEFLETLRAARTFAEAKDLLQIQTGTAALLEKIRLFCRCQYVILFVNLAENDTVLMPIAHAGIPEALSHNLPHFNWRKAGLAINQGSLQQTLVPGHAVQGKGIRGENTDYFANLACVVALHLGNTYRAVLGFGPFDESFDYQQERFFLLQIGRIIGWSVHTEIQLLNLRKKQQQSETITKLLTHQLRTALTPISTYVDTARILLKRSMTEANTKLITDSLTGAHALCLRLGASIRNTVLSVALLVERDDLKFERYPLSVLVSNCTEGYMTEAEKQQKQLIVENSVEYLPYATVDIARLTIVFSNLVDNAIKYSHPNTKIYVRAARRLGELVDLHNTIIEIQNEGDDIPLHLRERIFERGERGLTGAKLRRTPGTGIGLWEARSVLEAHNGKIELTCTPTGNYYRQNRVFRIVFTVKIPLAQK